MLVRAFDDDPVSNFMFAGPRRRHRGLHSFFTSELRHTYLPQGHVYVTEDLSGAALWGPPGRVLEVREPSDLAHVARAADPGVLIGAAPGVGSVCEIRPGDREGQRPERRTRPQ